MPPDQGMSDQSATSEQDETKSWIREQVARARPISGTPAERHLIEHRGLRPPWPGSLFWSGRFQSSPDVMPRPCLIATATNTDGEIIALQSTEITWRPELSRLGPITRGARGGLLVKARFSWGARLIRHKLWS